MQQLRTEQQQLQQHLDQLTTAGQLDVTGADSGYQYRVHSSLSESSNGSLSSSISYSSSEHGLFTSYLLHTKNTSKFFYHNFYNTRPILIEIDMQCLG